MSSQEWLKIVIGPIRWKKDDNNDDDDDDDDDDGEKTFKMPSFLK